MITNIKSHNFKAFDKLDVKTSRINLFLGPNNSGKSSILSVLRLLIQTIESYDSDSPLILNGIMGDFGTYKDMVYLNHRGRPLEIAVEMQSDSRLLKKINVELEYKYRKVRRELILNKSSLSANSRQLMSVVYSPDSEKHLIRTLGKSDVPVNTRSTLSKHLRMQNFLPRLSTVGMNTSLLNSLKEFIFRPESINVSCSQFAKQLTVCEYLSAMRMPPERTYLFTGEKRNRVGAHGENAANLLVMDSMRSGNKSLNLIEKVSNWLAKSKIAKKVDVVPISDRHFEIRFTHGLTKEMQNIADVGYGNSQVFPVLVGGYSLQAGSTYLVEEPEIHLHPFAQAELGDFFYDLYTAGIQTFIETHSEHLILRMQQLVAAGSIPASDICVYYVYPSEDTGKKIVKRLRLDNKGSFIDSWPEGFFPERLEEAKKLAKIRYEKTGEL